MSSAQKEECSSILSAPLFETENPIPAAANDPTPQNDGQVVVQSGLESLAVNDNPVTDISSGATKFSNLFGNCTFQNCEIKFS